MKTKYSLNQKLMLLAISLFLAAPENGFCAEASSSKGFPDEVIVQGGEKSGVRSEKPLLEIQLDANEPVLPAMEPEKELLQRQPEALRNPSAGFSSSLYNSNLILPARTRLAKDPIKVFYPLREILANSPSQFQEIGTGWEMTITDSEGRAFRKMSGRGLPPANVPWNGRSDRGEIASVGKNYSLVITYNDTRGQIRNFVGDPFSFDGILHQEPKGLVISLSLATVFETVTAKGVDSEVMGEAGKELLKETADWIKRYYFTYPVQVECYAKNQDVATARAQEVAKVLRSLMLLPRDPIPFQGYASTAVSADRIDLIMTNR